MANYGNSIYGFNRGPREMTDATCAECGKQCQVPFKPDGSRPVYCQDCYQNIDRPGLQEDIRAI